MLILEGEKRKEKKKKVISAALSSTPLANEVARTMKLIVSHLPAINIIIISVIRANTIDNSHLMNSLLPP